MIAIRDFFMKALFVLFILIGRVIGMDEGDGE